MLPTVKEQITKASMPAAASSPTDSHLLRPLHQVTSQDSLRISLDTLSSTLEEMDTTLISDQKSLEEEGSMINPARSRYTCGFAPVLDICIPVIGVRGVGKTNFIKSVCQLRDDEEIPKSTTIVSHGRVFDVRFTEIDPSLLDLNAESFRWPPHFSSVDGVLVCFDAANKDSLRIVPDILNALICTDVPSLLVACKSNIASRKVDLTLGTRVGAIFGVSAMDAGEDHSSCKPCVKTLLSAILEKRNVQSSRRRGSSIPPGFADLSHPPRQSSDRSNQALSNSSSRDTLVPNPQGRPSRSHTLKQTPPLVILPSLLSMDPGNLPYAASASTQLSINSANLDSRRGSGAVGSEFEEEGFNSEVISVSATDAWELQRDDPLSALDPNREDGQGSTWDELVDKLLAQPKSRTDVYFTTVFLVFYRKYAPPRQLLDSIMLRFDTATETSPDFLVAMMTRSRFCYILSQWVQEHPNDFYYPHTKQSLVSFVRSLADVSSLNHYYLELLPVVEDIPVNVEDPDAFWGLCDADFDDTQIDEMVSGKAGVVNSRHQPFVADLRRNKPEPDIGHPSSPAKGSRKSKDTDTESVAGSTKPASSDTAYDDKKLLNFIDVPDETMARELTRIEWGFFACLKPRDLLRHLWMSSSTKSNFSLVTQMINHFNHISNWVSSVILSRGKAKYRARTLEKFMNIAWLLRNLNNYNTLMAILAGINNASILRLHSTKELVKQRPAYRYFMSLERLMSSDRSFSAYRLAMKMTTGEKIPYLGIHLQDLLSIGEGNKSFLCESEKRIHWQKFSLMGEVVLGLLKCQDFPYRLHRDPIIERLIVESPTLTDEEMYKRSLEVEPRKAGQSVSSKFMAWVEHL